MDTGQVGALMIYGANPYYEYYDKERFKTAIGKVKLSISFAEKLDETSSLCNYLVPTHHYLESWGDAEPKSGYISFIQPTIHPLFKTRAFQTSLLKWGLPTGQAGGSAGQVSLPPDQAKQDTARATQTVGQADLPFGQADYETYFKKYWIAKLGSRDAFDTALQNGVIEQAAVTPSGGSPAGSGVSTAASAISSAVKGGKTELVLYQKVSIGTGKQAGNPWLQELPDPITRATWDNYAMMSMTMAKDLLGINLISGSEWHINNYEYYPEKPVIKVTVGKKELKLPVLIFPGMDPNTIAIAVGYGRKGNLGKAAEGVGQNAYEFLSFNGTTVDYFHPNITIADAKEKYRIAQTQIHNSYEGRTEVVRETTLATFKKYPNQFKTFRDELVKSYAPYTGDFRKDATLYPDHAQPGLKWGMSVDMNSCVSCGACIVACHAENNVPVVGKSEVARYHDMHWLRVDRYFVTNEKNPEDLKAVVFQPMMCQHCDNAPCENVCPVAATVHSAEGINQMAYNRCIGTRYCANNCPYKVRRFNWADYTGSTSFGKGGAPSGVGVLDDVVHQMNDDLTRMVLNPDVVSRSRGVMEKCTFCVQRLQEGKLKAKLENRELKGDEITTACAQACPTTAIVFSNVNDKTSQVAQIRKNNPGRMFYVIEQLHTLPNVNYLAKVRNTDELIETEETQAGHAAQSETPGVPSEHKEGH